MKSYQHTYADPIQVHLHADEETTLVEGGRRPRSTLALKLGAAVMLAIFLLAVVTSSGGEGAGSLRAAGMVAKADGPAKPEYDYKKDLSSKEGEYDWQKCKESTDPDCWKNEGKRVGSFWKSFGEKMHSFWESMAFWKKAKAEEEVADKE